MKKLLCLLLALSMVFAFAACAAPAEEEAPAPDATGTETEAPAEDLFIAIESKGFQHQFWQTVLAGSEQAAEDLGVEIDFQGPDSETNVSQQLDQLNALLAREPDAVALAALDTESVTEILNQLKADGVPVVAFDSGVPGAPEGTIQSTASTDNEAAAAAAADEMFAAEAFAAAFAAATPEAPVRIACQSQDATSGSIVGRTDGFVNQMAALAEEVFPGQVSIEGHDKWAMPVDGAAVIIDVQVPATTEPADASNVAQSLLAKEDLIGFFASNEASVGGILAATTDGTDLAKDGGKYADLTVIGFDAGANQKNAVKEGWFYGSITQDPFMIGYLAVELAYKAVMGETLDEIVDTGYKFYTAENMEQEDIAILLYD